MELYTPPEDGKELPQLRNNIEPLQVCHVDMNAGVRLGTQVLLETITRVRETLFSTSSWSSSFTPLCVVKSRGSSHSGCEWP